jgi:hypothetical protein
VWLYDQHELNPDLSLWLPMPNGSLELIEHLWINTVIKTLGSMTCPSGSSVAAIERIQTQGQEWVGRVKATTLSHSGSWLIFSFTLSGQWYMQ